MESRPPFCWVYVIFRFFGRPGPLLAPFGLDFEGFPKGFWLEIDGFPTGFGLDFEGFPRRFGRIVFLVLDGLVGSREALRISYHFF